MTAERKIHGDPVVLVYTFKFKDGETKRIKLELDPADLSMLPVERKSYPEWTKLSFHQCANCPLNESEHPRCPIAANMAELVDAFKDSISHHEVEIRIDTPQRTFYRKGPMQYGVSSLIGVYMVTSGCPVMDKLRPMVATHLPFASLDETMYRVISMYLLAQYLRQKRNLSVDWDLKNLVPIYEAIRIVNKHFCERLSEIHIQDASLNAVVVLDSFADFTTFAIEQDTMERLEKLFEPYLK